ncbi:uncharacterized protein [Haliotis cracherodii]|uniref:uncharacterized protein n=1 Tax=Haliotis cracherodii TaxID=6455 RepID=UPI0039EA4576
MTCNVNLGVVLMILILPLNTDAAVNKVYECRLLASGGLIDLNPLSNLDNTPRFHDIPDNAASNFMYSWNPCAPFSEGNGCQGVELCQISPTTDEAHVLGKGGDSRFVFENPGRVFFVYSILSDLGQTRETYIELVCNASVEAQLVFQGENPVLKYHMALTSKYACPKPVPTNSTTSPVTTTHSSPVTSPSTTPSSPVTPRSTTPSSPVPPPSPAPTSTPGPNIFNLETITILLACIFLSLVFLLFLVFIGLITRR